MADYCPRRANSLYKPKANRTIIRTCTRTTKVMKQEADARAEVRVTDRRRPLTLGGMTNAEKKAAKAATPLPAVPVSMRYNAKLADSRFRPTLIDILADEARFTPDSDPYTLRDALDAFGYFPVVSKPADIGAGFAAAGEGDVGGALLSFAAVLPVGDVLKLVRKNLDEAAVTGARGIVRSADEVTEVLWRQLPAYHGGKTSGLLDVGGSSSVPLTSGYGGPIELMPRGLLA